MASFGDERLARRMQKPFAITLFALCLDMTKPVWALYAETGATGALYAELDVTGALYAEPDMTGALYAEPDVTGAAGPLYVEPDVTEPAEALYAEPDAEFTEEVLAPAPVSPADPRHTRTRMLHYTGNNMGSAHDHVCCETMASCCLLEMRAGDCGSPGTIPGGE